MGRKRRVDGAQQAHADVPAVALSLPPPQVPTHGTKRTACKYGVNAHRDSVQKANRPDETKAIHGPRSEPVLIGERWGSSIVCSFAGGTSEGRFIYYVFDRCGFLRLTIETTDTQVQGKAKVQRINGHPWAATGAIDRAVWLVETKRPKSTIRFCGTLDHPIHSDRLSLTVQALLHDVYDATAGELAFADMQGSTTLVNGRECVVLFDPMSHSIDSDTGLGDHGPEGIEAFVTQHRCDYICKALGLAPFQNDASADDEEEED
ncbi:hypothetical protein NMY22_g16465 [Coprinellus aureogranulatus]|nr:hypothetical protein NMY22_g16465 [Coprinellus aureogranulatus]